MPLYISFCLVKVVNLAMLSVNGSFCSPNFLNDFSPAKNGVLQNVTPEVSEGLLEQPFRLLLLVIRGLVAHSARHLPLAAETINLYP
jgi:hypothetical protein